MADPQDRLDYHTSEEELKPDQPRGRLSLNEVERLEVRPGQLETPIQPCGSKQGTQNASWQVETKTKTGVTQAPLILTHSHVLSDE